MTNAENTAHKVQVDRCMNASFDKKSSQHGDARYSSTARMVTAQFDKDPVGKEQHSIAQKTTAQAGGSFIIHHTQHKHSTAQHSTGSIAPGCQQAVLVR